ncbi:MAG TPA: primosomal protein N' [Lachnospiraceae bacterium]|nr:primosomal protein N' [Lachnospiraceae bacterium]
MIYAGVIVDISHEKLDKIFQYSVPEDIASVISIGNKVNIPFGAGHRTGYVVNLSNTPEIDPDKIRPLDGIVKSSTTIDERMIKLAYWMKTNYGSTINQALKTVIPVKEKVKQVNNRTVRLLISPREALSLSEEYRTSKRKQSEILKFLSDNPVCDYRKVTQQMGQVRQSLTALSDAGLIEIDTQRVFRNELEAAEDFRNVTSLNQEQRVVCDGIIKDYDNNDMTPCLIKGVTGSGKTEVYMEIIQHVLSKGREVIVLIPEISLTYQTIMRFYAKFGNVVSVINSRLSKGEKYDRFELAAQGRIKIMVGPRSALFTPFNNLGAVIIDEEHESAYQSETIPRYHARETAIELARMTGAKVIMGSATPSLETFNRCKSGIYKLYRLDNRAGNATIPDVDVVDLRDEMKKGNRTMFSTKLKSLMQEKLDAGEQIMLFLNRRGYQGFINCRECGNVIQCPHCDVSLTLHGRNRLVCHYCGYETVFNHICPKCGSKYIGAFKAGTEKVEEETRKIFPHASVLRMDLDTTSGKEGHRNILEKFASHEADILIGTQMIVKGHDFADVTLVGILLADMSLHCSDYRAAEITFDLLTQAAGRAGRGDRKGNVVIQTYDPEHYSIVHAARQDYDAFYDEEMGYRELMGYPPSNHMMAVRISCADADLATKLSDELYKLTSVDDRVNIIGPADAAVYKINDIYNRVIYYKCRDYALLIQIKDIIENYLKRDVPCYKECHVVFDFR